MIAETLPKLGDHVKRIELYRVYTDKWIKDQSRRKGALLTAAERKVFVKALAVKLFFDNRSSCNYKEFTSIVQECLHRVQSEGDKRFETDDAVSLDYLGSDIQTCTFLVRDVQGNYSFRHKSFMEFFVAQELSEELKRGVFRYIEGRVLPVDIREFLIDFLSDSDSTNPSSNQPVIDILLKGLNNAENDILKDNLLTILSRLGVDSDGIAGKAKQVVDFIKGDTTAFDTLYKENILKLRLMLSRMGASKEEAEDICADVFFVLWQKRHSIESINHFGSYLLHSARNIWFDRIRKGKKEQHFYEMLGEFDGNEALVVDQTKDIEASLHDAIALLSPLYRDVLTLRVIENKTHDEIARLLGISVSKVVLIRRKAAEQLRIYLKNI